MAHDTEINLYGDRYRQPASGCGVDIASQRSDELDRLSLSFACDLVNRGETPIALDAACGLGGQAFRLAAVGAKVTAFDAADLAETVAATAAAAGLADRVTFVRGDLREVSALVGGPFNIICCQRAIHYLPWAEAVSVVKGFAGLLAPAGRLYLSASGLGSELGVSYPHALLPRASRYAPLSPQMASKHGIVGPVCLYTPEDLRDLFTAASLTAMSVFASPFGNIKGIAG